MSTPWLDQMPTVLPAGLDANAPFLPFATTCNDLMSDHGLPLPLVLHYVQYIQSDHCFAFMYETLPFHLLWAQICSVCKFTSVPSCSIKPSPPHQLLNWTWMIFFNRVQLQGHAFTNVYLEAVALGFYAFIISMSVPWKPWFLTSNSRMRLIWVNGLSSFSKCSITSYNSFVSVLFE